MRLKIIHAPTASELDGMRLGRFRVGFVYEMPSYLANVFLAEGWAIPVADETPAFVLPPKEVSGILVVEDDDDMRAIAVELLSAIGQPVSAARNGQEALRLLREKRPAIVVLDLMMPVMDGWQFRLAQQRLDDRQLATIPVVLLTAVPDPERYRRELDAVDVIPKPVENFDRLVDTVKHWLNAA